MIHIKKYTDKSQYNSNIRLDYSEPWVCLIQSTNDVKYNKTAAEKARDALLNMNVTFEVLGSGVIKYTSGSIPLGSLKYKKNNDDWVIAQGATINVVEGDVVEIANHNASDSTNNSLYWRFGGTTCRCNLKGNLDNLFNSTQTGNVASYKYFRLFMNCTGLVSAKDLILPDVPANGNLCYSSLFKDCTSLIEAPELPAFTLGTSAYHEMFNGCTSLNHIRCLASDISGEGCTQNWVKDVSSTGTFECLSTTNWTTGVDGIPSGWTVQTITI